jgi:Xaa-Pro dipeptidase
MTVIAETEGFFWRGADSLKVRLSMHQSNRRNLYESLIAAGASGDAVILSGGGEIPVYNTDTVWDFRQESNFQYLFGVKEPGCFGIVGVKSEFSILFIPRLPKEYEQWLGPIKPPAWFKSHYQVDEVFFVDEMETILRDKFGIQSLLYYDFTNLDSGLKLVKPTFEGSDSFKFVGGPLFANVINELRVIKTQSEIEILQYTNDVSCKAHIDTMKEVYSRSMPKVVEMEHFAETNFRYQAGLGGCARVGYNCIACSGINNAVLHYGHAAEPNNMPVEPNSLRLLDMGAEYHCYTADVTVTFPTSGKFSEEQKIIYEAVWKAVLAVETIIRPGVDYRDMHRLSQRVILEELLRTTRIFNGGIEELVQHNICSYFYPHGLGHSLGLDVHDVGGYLPGQAKDKADLSIKGLRLGRELKENMVLTVEPGFYFIDYLIRELESDPVKSKLINFDELSKYRNVGGVRIEDNVVITKTGCRVLSDVPRTVKEIESVMSGKREWIVGQQYRIY